MGADWSASVSCFEDSSGSSSGGFVAVSCSEASPSWLRSLRTASKTDIEELERLQIKELVGEGRRRWMQARSMWER